MVSKLKEDRIPDINLVVVPLLPASSDELGFVNPSYPLPVILRFRNSFLFSMSICTPKFESTFKVDKQSLPLLKLLMIASPNATELRIAER